MSQIAYQEAFDAYHTIFRILRVLTLDMNHRILPIDHVRILDFYLLFPFRIKDFCFQRPHVSFRKIAGNYDDAKPYGDWPDDRSLLARMQPIQMAALSTLARFGLIDAKLLLRGEIKSLKWIISSYLEERIAEANDKDGELSKLLKILIAEYRTTGQDGIKARSRLLEHRYDAAV